MIQSTIKYSMMDRRNPSLQVLIITVLVLSLTSSSYSHRLYPHGHEYKIEDYDHTMISDFRLINRMSLIKCPIESPYIQINASATSALPNEGNITVTVSGVLHPATGDWVAMVSPSTADIGSCPLDAVMYMQTGDLASLPLLCHYPVKAQYVSNDPGYLSCQNSACQDSSCLIKTCSGSITFHYTNIRTDLIFVFFAGGVKTPCILATTQPIQFANPASPLYGHLSSIDSTATSMTLTWVSGDQVPQQVLYGNNQSQTSVVTTFTQNDMCTTTLLPSPAKDFGWHDPGYVHSAVMTGLLPSTTYSYQYGSNSVGWSNQIQFRTPPAGGSNELTFLAFGDMGKTPLDPSIEHYIQPGAESVIQAMASEVAAGNIDAIYHIGDISYATGFLVEWDFFLNLIEYIASSVSYMTSIGNHERDYINSGSVYITPDSGGECGVPYETYFPMPTPAKDKPWYSIEQGPVHFTVISTEHPWSVNSEQYNWMQSDMASVNRSRTPWLIFAGHRPMYSSIKGLEILNVDPRFVSAVEPLLLQYQVDLALFGHVHNYERLCAVYQKQCLGMPVKDANGIDTYDNGNYTAPVHVIIGMAGFTLDSFTSNPSSWSLVRISEFGYSKVQATPNSLLFQFVNAHTRQIDDSFYITK